ncbi:MAG: hypothetical protein ACK4SZ_10305 [Allosphingosinicella sp.]|uniref:hypothetical protein n=1 Tax=Allosphingosinicella sp. TaxID=2823234 RepID=UPI003941EC44
MPDEPSFLPPGPLPLIGPDFHVISPLGRIGDGLVYAARDGLTRVRLREYAPPGVVRRGPNGILGPVEERFAAAWQEGLAQLRVKREALAAVDHPGVAPVFAAAPDGYLVGAPVGEPLSATLAGGLVLPPYEVQLLARDLAAALAEVHARGVTHLDVSPDTVSIASGAVQLTDFAVDNRHYLPLLETQEGLVRPGYSPIELHDGTRAEPLGPRTDVYAASVLVFRLIVGRDPAPWQDRWRDPAASELPDDGPYPPEFLAAIRAGMAVEPEARFANAAQWLAAMGPPPAPPIVPLALETPSEPVPAEPPAPPPPAPPPPPRRRSTATPLIILLVVLVGAAVGGLFAWQEGWFDQAAQEEPSDNRVAERPKRDESARTEEPAPPLIEVGGTVSGRLTRNDQRRDGGQYQDLFTLAGSAGQRIELRLSSGEFDPLVLIDGPGFRASNDDDVEQGTLNSRLAVTLPRAGRYTISVTSYTPGATGDYLLEVLEPGPAPEVVAPALLDGRWRLASDMRCGDPLIFRIDGSAAEIEHKGRVSRGVALDGVGRVIRLRMDGGPPAGADLAFLMADDGESFTHDGETWVRC